MRRQGKIVEWNDARGFGFVVLNGSDERAFAHISDFADRRARPAVGDVVTYDVVTERGRPKATAIAYAGAAAVARKQTRPARAPRDRRVAGGGWVGAALFVAIVAVVVWRYHHQHQQRLEHAREYAPPRSVQAPASARAADVYQCTGKQHCSQMASCGEARFYLQHCPDTKMDGDGDGEPCEDRCGY
ncbi:MAG TPA: excalibur calcium-binding domain-containing protein [Erythrobacter sp.]|nr:excalibur calcium-binding domain-containing protein [Erythrobacter sp.]